MKKATLRIAAILLVSTASFGQKESKLAGKAKVSRAEAEKIALAKEPGTIKEGELEKEHGKLIYSFDVQTAGGIHEVNVDAMNGTVVEDSIESAEAEAKEKAQEQKKAH